MFQNIVYINDMLPEHLGAVPDQELSSLQVRDASP